MSNVYWAAIYFGYGMTPRVKEFDSEEAALEWWDKNASDPHMSVSRLQKVEAIRTN